jgi:surface polysaccharide O-acyltransferase-like enzyme
MKRIVYFDILNVIACFCVVCMHCNGWIHLFIKDDLWVTRVLIEVVCYFAVPVFFMLSGATLLNYRQRYSTTEFYKKRFIRTVIPYLFWGIIFYIIYLLRGNPPFGWKETIIRFTTGEIPYTFYWFFIPLFLLYIFMPFFSLMVEKLKNSQLLFLCILLFAFQSAIPTIFSMANLKLSFQIPIAGYAIFMFLGYLLANNNYESNHKFFWSFSFVCLLLLICRYYLIYPLNEKSEPLFSYFGLYSILPSMWVFLFIKRIAKPLQEDRFSITWRFLASKSYGVYLLHAFFIVVLEQFIPMNSLLFITLGVIIIYLSAMMATCLLQLSRYTNYLLP